MIQAVKRMVGFLCLIGILTILSGCQSTNYASLPDSYNKETDYPYTFLSANEIAIAPVENGYYYVEGDFLFFLDGTSKEMAVVCNRPDCKHQYETDSKEVWKCDGYLGGVNFCNVQVYEGAVYTLTRGSTENDVLDLGAGNKLTKISLDGTKREDIRPVSITQGFAQPLRLHRGYAYYVADDKEKQALYRFPIDDPQAKVETVYSIEGNISGFIPYGNHVYIHAEGNILDYSITENQVHLLKEKYTLDGIYKDQLLVRSNDRPIEKPLIGEYELLDRSTKELSPFISLDTKDSADVVHLNTDGEQFFEWRVPLADVADTKYVEGPTYQFSVLDEQGTNLFSAPVSLLRNNVIVFAPGDERFAFIWSIDYYETGNVMLDLIDKENGFARTNVFTCNQKVLNPDVSSLK